jgi:hypothetical protein
MDENEKDQQEDYEAERFNTKALMAAYNDIAQGDAEFAQEYGQEAIRADIGNEKYVSGALMATYAQMMDAYREGTIDIEVDKNEIESENQEES